MCVLAESNGYIHELTLVLLHSNNGLVARSMAPVLFSSGIV